MSLTPGYENVHRGQSTASQRTTELFEASYDTIAPWLNAPSRRNIATYRNTTEAINAVMYSLLTEFRDGDNVVTTMLEHNSNFVPWYGCAARSCRGSAVGSSAGSPASTTHRRARPGPPRRAGRPPDQAGLLTGASNFLGTKPPLTAVRAIADGSGYRRADGELGVAAARRRRPAGAEQLVDVQALDVDYLAFSFHKVLAPFGVGVLYAKEHLLAHGAAVPLRRRHDRRGPGGAGPVDYNDLPWKYAAGTPNILGVIVSAQALRLLLDLVGVDGSTRWFDLDDAAPGLRSSQRRWTA